LDTSPKDVIDPTSEYTSSSSAHFLLTDFEGPLDLLLYLIKKNEVNIYDIPIGSITEQYLDYISKLAKVELEDLTEFYLMAATLLYIKSRMLLPVEIDLSDEIDDPRRELVERLIEYQKYKKLSELLGTHISEDEYSLEPKKKQVLLPFNDEDLWEEIKVWDLLQSFARLMKGLSSEKIIDLHEEVTVNEKITLINEYLEQNTELRFYDLLVKQDSIMEFICSFLAILEMVKSKKIRIFQNRMFGDILIKARQEE
jgi:segregation and condensation protein A